MKISANSAKRRALSRSFTLVELLAAMAVFVVILTMVFSMLAGAQRAYSAVDRTTRIYESARILMDLVTRDLQAAVASDTTGGEIPFTVDPTPAQDLLGFVAAVDPPSSADARLCEILYAFQDNIFKRSCVGDGSGSWDFFGTPTSNTGSWVTTGASRQEVVRGLESLTFTCFDSSNAMVQGTYHTLPSVVRVSFTLFDPEALDLTGDARTSLIDKTRRTFNKIIFLRSE